MVDRFWTGMTFLKSPDGEEVQFKKRSFNLSNVTYITWDWEELETAVIYYVTSSLPFYCVDPRDLETLKNKIGAS